MMLTTLLTLKNVILAIILALAVGFGLGFYAHVKIASAAHASALLDARKGDVRIVANSAKREERIALALRASESFGELTQLKIDSIPLLANPNDPEKTCSRDPVLNPDLVRLLNARP